MFRIQLTPSNRRNVLRNYSPSSLVSAYNMVKNDGATVYRAAKMHGVPITTLRDRVDDRISIDTTKSGPEPVLNLDEEERLCSHIKGLAEVGYGYTRCEVVNLATEYAVSLGKRTVDKPFSLQWFYDFMKRWPELKLVKPSSLSEQRAKCASEKSVLNYFTELNHIMSKYDLMRKPQNIYNIDEKGINTEYTPPNVVAGSVCKPQTIMSERSKTVTIIGAGNALGNHIPPYFVFPGERFLGELLDGKTPGADGTMTKSGWSNSEVFSKYMKQHFIKFAQGRDNNETLLVLYDGHRSHISVDLIDWALEQNILLFVLPPHTSHILQPMDVGCFGPLQVIYNKECTAFTRSNHRVVTRYDVCSLACKAYTLALSPSNLQSAFKRAGIYPLLDGPTMCQLLDLKLKPSTLYGENVNVCDQSEKENTTAVTNDDKFFESKSMKAKQVEKVETKKRKNVSNVIGGKALEGRTIGALKDYLSENESAKKSKSTVKKSVKVSGAKSEKTASKVSQKQKKCTNFNPSSPQPGPSRIQINESVSDMESESDSEPNGEGVCCVCNRYYVPKEKLDGSLYIVNWVACDMCDHWVHLKYCTTLRVARKDTPFSCNCCTGKNC